MAQLGTNGERRQFAFEAEGVVGLHSDITTRATGVNPS
jgi:hypothetical protein